MSIVLAHVWPFMAAAFALGLAVGWLVLTPARGHGEIEP